MMKSIKNYVLDGEFRPTGGGMCEWTFCRDEAGQNLFIKRFLKPKYPMPDGPGSPAGKQKQRSKCEMFERRQLSLTMALKKHVRSTGNLVTPTDFFRDGSFYYKVTPRIDRHHIEIDHIAKLGVDDVCIIMLTALHSLSVLHNANIVHGDLKPDNILIKKTEKSYAAKLIDFDDSYIFGEPPAADLIVGDQVYFAPEAEQYIHDGSVELSRLLTGQADIFALGIVFHQYWTGELPGFPRDRFRSLASAVTAGVAPEIAGSRVPEFVRSLIGSMLQRDPARRPNALDATAKINEFRRGGLSVSSWAKREPADVPHGRELRKDPLPAPRTSPGYDPATAGPRLKGKALDRLERDKARSPDPGTGVEAAPVTPATIAEPSSRLKGKVLSRLKSS